MKKVFSIFILTLLSFNSNSQFELFGGINKNYFFNYKDNGGYSSSEYTPANGYSFGLGYDTSIDSFPIKIRVSYENYSGNIYTYNGSQAIFSETAARISKNSINLGIYPINKKHGGFKFNLGGQLNFLASDITNGYQKNWIGQGPTAITSTTSLNNHDIRINNSASFGISTLLSYKFVMFCSWTVSPQINLYYGLSNEFKNIEAKTKSFRTTFSLTFSKGKCSTNADEEIKKTIR